MNLNRLLTEIKEKAAAATRGRWQERFFHSNIEWHDGKVYMSIAAHGPLHKADDAGVTATGHDMAHIALMSPDTALKLVEALNRAREALEYITLGKLPDDQGKLELTAGRMCSVARQALRDIWGEAP